MMTRSIGRSVTVVASLMSAGVGLAGQRATFQSVGNLDPDGFGPVIPYGVSGDGTVVVGQSNSPMGFQAFRWTFDDGLHGLGMFPNPGGFPGSIARACSFDGSVIVGSSLLPNSLNEDGSPFRWTAETGLVFLGSLGGSDGGVARGVSDDGSVVVGYGSNANFDPEAFRWTAESGIVGLDDLPGGVFNSQAAAVSADGTIAVGLASTGFVYNTSFKWNAEDGITQIIPTGFRDIGMSSNGVYAVGIHNGRAARVDLATGALLTIPHIAIPGLNTDTDAAWDASGDGSVVVGMQNLSQSNGFLGRAFIWDADHGTRIVRNMLIEEFGLGAELAGWILNNTTSVSDDGRVLAGYGFGPSGEQLGWVATLPGPVPAGDLNGDGAVDSLDLNEVLASFGCDSACAGGDADHDGDVDSDDLNTVLGAFGLAG